MASSDGSSLSFVPFPDAIKVEKLDPHVYKINLDESYCIGTVPNGGYAGSCMLAAASAHLSSRGQPDMLTVHFEYPGRTAAGSAIVMIEDVKIARQFSILHLTLWQGGLVEQTPWITPSISRRTVLAYTTYTNLRASTGMSVRTGYEAIAAAALPPPPDFETLKLKGADKGWKESKLPRALAHNTSSTAVCGRFVPVESPHILAGPDRRRSGSPIRGRPEKRPAHRVVVSDCHVELRDEDGITRGRRRVVGHASDVKTDKEWQVRPRYYHKGFGGPVGSFESSCGNDCEH